MGRPGTPREDQEPSDGRAKRTRSPKAALPSRRFERRLQRDGLRLVAGIDEVGRGCLAGPVLAAAVILPSDGRGLRSIAGVRDSKIMKPEERERLYDRILRIAVVGVGLASHRIIDRYGIAPATRVAMLKAVSRLDPYPDHVLIDAVRLPLLDVSQTAIIDGDALCLSIAAASIVAKVTRDRLMRKAAVRYPGYGFENHKGYGTAEHHEALIQLGPCTIHRLTFRPAFANCAIGEMTTSYGKIKPLSAMMTAPDGESKATQSNASTPMGPDGEMTAPESERVELHAEMILPRGEMIVPY